MYDVIYSLDNQETVDEWRPPSKDVLKINCDGSYCRTLKRIGLGFVVRNDRSEVEAVRASYEEGRMRIQDIEGKALMIGMEMAVTKGWGKVIFESDSLAVVEGITKHSLDKLAWERWGNKCITLLAQFTGWSLSHILRELNDCANLIARKACFERWSWECSLAIPWIIKKVC